MPPLLIREMPSAYQSLSILHPKPWSCQELIGLYATYGWPDAPHRQRCLYFHDASCLECVTRCPVGALDANQPLDKQACYRHLLDAAQGYQDLGLADVCGKCATGPCALESAVQ